MSISGIGGVPPPGLSEIRPVLGRALLEALSTLPETGAFQGADSITLQAGLGAADVVSLLERWSQQPPSTESAAHYQAARMAAQAGDLPEAVAHLQQAIAGHPGYVAEALQDGAFAAGRSGVLELATRLTNVARMNADTTMLAAENALRSPASAGAAALATTCLAAAEAQMRAQTYVGYLAAAEAAAAAERLSQSGPVVRSKESAPRQPGWTALVGYGVRYLRYQYPLLLALLAWFAAGVAVGGALFVLGAVFPDGGFAAWRQTLMPIWGYGLVALVAGATINALSRWHVGRS